MADLPELTRRVLAALITASQPLSGRRVASLAGASPTATIRALAQLAELGAASVSTKGNAKQWSSTSAASDLLGATVEREALILTALPLEYAAMRERLNATGERRAASGARYCEGRVRGNDITWTVRVFETKMGNASAASALARAAGDFPPDLVVFSGIAGGLRGDKQTHGDVVIVENVYNGAAGKSYLDAEGESAVKHRLKPVSAPMELVNIADSIVREPAPLPGTFTVSVVDLVSTETVEADPHNELAQTLRRALDQVVAVDMESFGVYTAARHLGVPAISVRGLSDLGGDKTAAGDAKWQPVAAANAAAVAVELLIRAHPGDLLPRRSDGPDDPRDTGCPGGGAGASADPGFLGLAGGRPSNGGRALPPYTQRWIAELGQRSAAAANAARADLSSAKAPPRTTVNVLTTHPPAWLREDRTGAGWAAVATFADAVGSRAARGAWSQAAATAQGNSDSVAAVLFAINHARSSDNENGRGSEETIATTRAELEAIDVTGAPELAPVVAAWVRMSRIDDTHLTQGRVEPDVLDAAGKAIAALGGGKLLPRLAQQHAKAAPVSDAGRTVAEHGLLNLLLSVTVYLLIHQDGRASAWAEAAIDLAPWSSEARLRHLQVRLQGLHDSLRVGESDSVTQALIEIEEGALAIRTERRSWGGSTDEALALAGRARIEMDDARGALRLLTGAPRGTATDEEAKSVQVAQFATVAALRIGDVELSAELAEAVTPDIERHFLRAATYGQAQRTRHLAEQEYRAALALARSPYELERALGGLARSEVDVNVDADASAALEKLARLDNEAADMVRAWTALVSGDALRALTLARRYQSLAAVELAVDALSTLGRSADAVQMLDGYGRRTGDVTLRMQAMQLAGRAGLWERASALADAIIDEAGPGPMRDAARCARSDIAARAGDWETVERQLLRVVRERAEADHIDNDPAASPYAWQLAEALYRQRKYPQALAMLRRELDRPATDPDKVRLALALMHRTRAEHAELIDEQVIDWVLNVASSLLAHEDIGASAISLLTALPGELRQGAVVRVGQLFDDYFARYGHDGSVREMKLQPDPDDPDSYDFAPLIEQIRSSFEPHAEARTELGDKVLAGRLPLGFLAIIAQRSYAEMLLVRALNQYVARPAVAPGQRWVKPEWVDNARAALKAGTVVVDTSALVLADAVADRRALLAHFDAPLIPRSLQDDIYRARERLALRSAAFMGWDAAAQRPILIKYDERELDGWAAAGVDLHNSLRALTPVQDAYERDRDPRAVNADAPNIDMPLTAQATARQLGHAMWADDVALLALAEAENVPAFGTPELIAALREDHPDEQLSEIALLDRLKRARVVDLPVDDNWTIAAAAEHYSPDAYMRLAITRPAAWVDVPASFARYQQLIRALWASPELANADTDRDGGGDSAPDLDARRVYTAVLWCEAACVGLGRAIGPAPVKASVISALIAWTALNTDAALDAGVIPSDGVFSLNREPVIDGPRTLGHLLELGRRLQHAMFPGGDAVRSVIGTLTDTIRSVSDTPTAAGVLARALGELHQPLRSDAFAALLKAPRTTT